jgi:hypothetical protein
VIRSGPALSLARQLCDVLAPECSDELVRMVADRIMIGVRNDEMRQQDERQTNVVELLRRCK